MRVPPLLLLMRGGIDGIGHREPRSNGRAREPGFGTCRGGCRGFGTSICTSRCTALRSGLGSGSPAVAASAPLTPATHLQGPPRGEAARALPIVLQARTLRGQPDVQTVAEGDVEFRRGGLVIRADRIAYDVPEDRASAKGRAHRARRRRLPRARAAAGRAALRGLVPRADVRVPHAGRRRAR
ncbi:MAG: hypothetical protein U1F49_00365 [Rubrivivax sp.]